MTSKRSLIAASRLLSDVRGSDVPRDLFSDQLPCKCGATLGEHAMAPILTWPYERRMHEVNGCTGFAHADTPPCDPSPSSDIGHVFRGYDSRLYRIVRIVRFRSSSGLDFEIEPFRDDPNAPTTTKFERRCISARAIGRTFHHSRECTCGGGYER